jgi:hypothetical protein
MTFATYKLKSENPRKNDSRIWRRKDLRQSVALFAKLFRIVRENVIRNIETNRNGRIFNRTRQPMAYADVALIRGRSVRAIKEVETQIK